MAIRLPDGSIRMSDGRIIYANSLILGADLCEIIPLCVPPPAWPFVSGGGGGGPGPQGPAGPAGTGGGGGGGGGSQGSQGFQGTNPGVQGPQGSFGFQGNQGFQGLGGAGIQGPQGLLGTQGAQGFQGLGGTGVQGPQGSLGAQGNQGFQGAQGALNPDLFASTRIVSLIPGEGTDLTIAAAIAALPAAGGDIYIKPGTYPIAAPLDFTTKVVRLRGAGTSVNFTAGPTTLVPAAGISVFMNGEQGSSVEDLTVEGDNASSQVFYEGSAEIRFTRINVHDVAGIIKGTGGQPDVLFKDSYINVPSGVTIPLADRYVWKGSAANGTLIWDNVEVFITGSGATLMSGVTAGANGPTFKVVNSYTGGGGGGGATNFWFAQVIDWVGFDIDNAQFQISGARNNVVNCNFLDCSIKFLAIWNFISNSNFSQGGTNGGGGIFDAQLSFEQSLAGFPIQSTVTGCNFYGNGVSNKGVSVTGPIGATSISVTITGCNFSNHTLNDIFISAGLDIMITGCVFDHSTGANVSAISIVAGASFSARVNIVGNTFGSGYTLTVSTAGFNGTIANNINLLTIADTGNGNIWTGNTNMDPSGITGSAASDLINDTNVIGPVAADVLLNLFYRTVTIDASAAPRTVTLPTAASAKWRKYIIKKVDASANTVTIDADGAETIDGALTYVLIAQYQDVEIQSDGSTWWIL